MSEPYRTRIAACITSIVSLSFASKPLTDYIQRSQRYDEFPFLVNIMIGAIVTAILFVLYFECKRITSKDQVTPI